MKKPEGGGSEINRLQGEVLKKSTIGQGCLDLQHPDPPQFSMERTALSNS